MQGVLLLTCLPLLLLLLLLGQGLLLWLLVGEGLQEGLQQGLLLWQGATMEALYAPNSLQLPPA
jgi:hypothetical protein